MKRKTWGEDIKGGSKFRALFNDRPGHRDDRERTEDEFEFASLCRSSDLRSIMICVWINHMFAASFVSVLAHVGASIVFLSVQESRMHLGQHSAHGPTSRTRRSRRFNRALEVKPLENVPLSSRSAAWPLIIPSVVWQFVNKFRLVPL